MRDYRWYLSAVAVRQWLAIRGLPDDDGGPYWGIAERELGELAEIARDTGQRSRSGAQTWRAKWTIQGRRRRVELTVMPDPRPEGPLPQLVQVRLR